MTKLVQYYFPNNALMIALPFLRSTPDLLVGIPVALINSRLTFMTPSTHFQEKLSHGIFVLLILQVLHYLSTSFGSICIIDVFDNDRGSIISHLGHC